MNVILAELPPAGRPVLERLMQLYAYDFSELMAIDMGEDGLLPTSSTLATCWAEPWRHPFLIRADERIAGFVVVDEQSRLTGDPAVVDMAEFFVLRRFRRHGVGRRAARLAFERYLRRWEVRETPTNTAATAFWRRVIADYTGGRFSETVRDDERWRGPVQSFDVAQGADR
jgi:predicted acetyltransferase